MDRRDTVMRLGVSLLSLSSAEEGFVAEANCRVSGTTETIRTIRMAEGQLSGGEAID